MFKLHDELMEHLINNPNEIEEGFEILKTKFTVNGGIIDILGKDDRENYCLIELKTHTDDVGRGKKQLLRYGKFINKLLELFDIKKYEFRYFIIKSTKNGLIRHIFGSKKILKKSIRKKKTLGNFSKLILHQLKIHKNGLTIQNLSDLVGTSRVSISKYIYGLQIEKKVTIRNEGRCKIIYWGNKNV